ncbi:hypothetical protein FHETE_3236 [Fusarium heterosporum]|uniref:Heterokaryon incompatibility domain-containing protein n=1 Tax=Fusarium heterosporum TaxID=42747 RepID=A0A8H5WXP9_FUSHE|nr:hypothetical protein FHETE_3236 [Fusarium heterosporum]
MAPTLKRIIFENIRDHRSTSIFERALQKKDDKPLEKTPDTAAMVRDWEEVCEINGKRGTERQGKAVKESMADIDGMTDEQLGRINITTSFSEKPEAQGLIEGDVEDEQDVSRFEKYKHHQYVRRWGLFSDSDGRDEEWFIADPTVLEQTDPQYLCDMCRHIDFKVLFSERGLPGNYLAGATRISLYGLHKVMDESNQCAFCRLLRTRIIHDGIFSYDRAEEWDCTPFSLNVLDDGPDYALRFEIEFTDQDLPKKRLVIHSINQESDQLQPLHGLMVQKDTADMSRLRGWLHTCNESHRSQGLDSTRYLSPLPNKLRVIDTTGNYITEVDMPCEYICLSYVWGTGSQTQYTTETRDQLSRPGGLDSANLPQTIVDAIKVTKELGVRYIWIDALCITQDNDDDKAKIISNMANIYANAVLSIMASTNVNPTDGLPGVGVPRTNLQHTATMQGITLAIAFQDPRQRHFDIEDQLWNNRAWTFQERVLSRRSVFFTDSQMCFVCPHGAAFEDTAPVVDPGYTGKTFNEQTQLSSRAFDLWMRIWTDPTQSVFVNKSFESENETATFVGADEDCTGEIWDNIVRIYRYKSIASSNTIDAPIVKGDTMWETYAHAVDIYTKRNMSWQSDAVNAFTGIADLIRRGTNTKFWQALPEFALSRALLWYAREPLTRRRSEDGQALFPSWSWAAWKGHVSYRGRGWHNAVAYAPVTMVMWCTTITAQELMENYMREERTQEDIDEYRRQVESAGTLLELLNPRKLLHFEYEEQGWRIEQDNVRNQHVYLHEAYPGVRLDSPMSLPGESIVELPSKDSTLYFRAKAVPARLCDKPATAHQASPIQDNFLQIGLNDEDCSANARKPWQRILYHQGYRAGSLTLNVPLQDLNIPCTSETTSEKYFFAAITRHGLPHMAPMPIDWDRYWSIDPMLFQQKVVMEEWTDHGDAPPEPDEGVEPDCEKVNETGDPRWDTGRFGAPVVFDVCDVLLLRKKEGVCERVGVGKVSFCAFYAAKPEVEMIVLK